jgi:transposase
MEAILRTLAEELKVRGGLDLEECFAEAWIWRNASSMAPSWWPKRGRWGGKTKRGKGTKLMAVADGTGLPIAICVTSARLHEVTLVEPTLAACFAPERPRRLIGDRAYDSTSPDARLAGCGIEMIPLHRRNRRMPRTHDGRKLRRYKRRWKIERLFACLGNFRRLVFRYERHLVNYLGFVPLACIIILLRRYLR